MLRHRIKLNFEAITERVSADDVVTMILDELNGKKVKKAETVEVKEPEQSETPDEQNEEGTQKRRKKFGRK